MSQLAAPPRIVFIGSTGGAVLSRLLQHAFVREATYEVVSDRECGFLEVARRSDLPCIMLKAVDGESFSDKLQNRYGRLRGLVFVSFYTRLFRGRFVRENKGFLFNCHPSILPSCKGMRGFEETLESGSLFMGCSLHMVDEGMDTGASIIQAALPLDRQLPVAVNRHKVFLAQYYSTLQFIRWAVKSRLTMDAQGVVRVLASRFAPSIFSPNLDPDFFDFAGISNELT